MRVGGPPRACGPRQDHGCRQRQGEGPIGRAAPSPQSHFAGTTSPEPSRRSEVARSQQRPRQFGRSQTTPLQDSSEAKAWEACAERWDRRVVQVSAVIATPTGERSPDHYGLGQQLAQWPEEAPRRRVKSVISVARPSEREPDSDDYEGVWVRPSTHH